MFNVCCVFMKDLQAAKGITWREAGSKDARDGSKLLR